MAERLSPREVVVRSMKRSQDAVRREKDKAAPAIAAVSERIEARARIAERLAALDAGGLIATEPMRAALERQMKAADEALSRAMRAALAVIAGW